MSSTSPRWAAGQPVSLQSQLSPAIASRRQQWKALLLALAASDLFSLGLAFRLAYSARFEWLLPIFSRETMLSLVFYRQMAFLLLPLMLVSFAIAGLYDRKNLLGGTFEYSRLFNAITTAILLVVIVGFLDPGFVVARAWVLLAWVLAVLFSGLGRFLIRRLVYFLRHYGYFLTPAVIVGANDEGQSLADQLLQWKTSGLYLLGFIDEKFPAGARLPNGLPVLGCVADLEELAARHRLEEIILASSSFSSRDGLLDIFNRFGVASGVNVRMSSGLYEIITTGLSVKEFAYVPLVGVNPVRLTGLDQLFKALMDLGLGLPGLLLILPFMLAIAALIRLDSPGPVIHRRRVMGVNGRQFDAYKFRTMHVNGDEILAAYPALQAELAANHKLKVDPRITRVGAFLRKTSLDELPQLLNVLKGEMSLVGPRMITLPEIEKYDRWDKNLLTVRPGITGLWQVSGRSDVSYDERVRLDMWYIKNWSIWLDLQLLVQTIPAVLMKRGAY